VSACGGGSVLVLFVLVCTVDGYHVYNLVGLSFSFESHIPENVGDQMNDILVENENLIHDRSFDRVAEIKSSKIIVN
jgi:hypothetical protein